jgi:hypothetical protein
MIDHNINLKISNPTQRKYYRDKDIYCNIGDTININISLLPEYSHIKINVKCENCGFEKLIQYSDYLKCIKKQNFYCCSKCKRIKTDKTNIERYGFITNLKCEDTKDKIKKTCLEKYGVVNIAQNFEIFKKQQLSGYRIKSYEDVTYQGTYELDFLLNFYNILKIENPPSIKYKYQDKSKVYHPDFYLPDYNLIVEIKSNYIYELHKELNECKKLSAIENGYNFIFIFDKEYTNFKNLFLNFDNLPIF